MADVTMYDRSGKAVAVPEEQAATAYRSGALTFAEGTQLSLRRGSEQVTMSGAEAANLLQSREGQYFEGGSSEAAEEQALRQEYSGLWGQTKAFGAGAARGLSLGLSDVAISELGGDDARQELQRLNTYGAGAGLAGEVVGTVGGALLSGGSGLLARGASAGVRAGAAVGSLAERAAVRGGLSLGLAEGGAAVRALGTAAGFGAEGALYAAGAEAGRQAVANEKYDGEKLVAAGLHGALAGAAVGGAGSLAASGVSRVARWGAEKALDGAIAVAEKAGGRASSVAHEGEGLEEKISRLVDAVSPGGAEKYAAEKTLKGTGGTQKQLGKIIDSSDAVQRKAQEIMEERLPAALGLEKGAIMPRPQMAEGMPIVIRQEGEKIGGALKALDAAGAEGPSIQRIADQARTGILADLKSNVFAKREAGVLEDAINGLREYEGSKITFEGLHELSSRLGETIRGRPNAVETEALSKFRGLIEGEIERAGDKAAETLGQQFAGAYREAKQSYAAAKMLDKAIATGVERETANRSLGLSEQLGLLGGLAQGGVWGLAAGAANAYAANLAKRYGDQAAAYVLREVSRGRPVSEAVGRVVDQVVGESVKGLFSKASKGAKSLGSGAARGGRLQLQEQGRAALDDRAMSREFDRRREQVLAGASSAPEGVPPEAAASAQATAERAQAFLRGKIPPVPGQGVGLQPHLSRLRPSLEAQRKFLEYARAVEDPMSVLADLQRGKIPRAGLEVIREVYPELDVQVKAKAAELLAEQKERLGPEEARRIAAVLGIPAGPTDTPAYLLAVQAGYLAQPAGGAPGAQATPGQPPARPVNAARAYDPDGASEEAA